MLSFTTEIFPCILSFHWIPIVHGRNPNFLEPVPGNAAICLEWSPRWCTGWGVCFMLDPSTEETTKNVLQNVGGYEKPNTTGWGMHFEHIDIAYLFLPQHESLCMQNNLKPPR